MTVVKAGAAQLLAAAVVAAVLLALGPGHRSLWVAAFAQGVLAASIAAWLRSERWWLAIHLLFVPAAVLASRLQIAPGWYLGAFVLCALVYWSSYRTRVPLYLSNAATARAVSGLLAERPAGALLDLGSGTGALLRPLARRHPEWRFTGIESAPLPYLAARLACRGEDNLELLRGDFFSTDWGRYDVVYAFLSPVPMARVWAKAQAEMRPDSLLISNSFEVPDTPPMRTVEVGDRRRTRLLCFRPGSGKTEIGR